MVSDGLKGRPRPARLTTTALAFVSCFAATEASANLLTNGGFDDAIGGGNGGGNGGFGPFTLFNAPNQGIPGWTLVSGSLEVWTNYQGSGGKVLDMTGRHTGFPGGLGPATLEQSFATLTGTQYAVSFLMGGSGSPAIKDLEVAILGDGGAIVFSQVFSLDTSALPHSGDLVIQQFNFMADSDVTKINFRSLNDSTFDGPYLDSVNVSAVPVPAALSLLGPALLGLLGMARRRKA